jgi:hypothetical protein
MEVRDSLLSPLRFIRLVTATVSFVHFLVFLLLVQLALSFSTAFGHVFVEITFG